MSPLVLAAPGYTDATWDMTEVNDLPAESFLRAPSKALRTLFVPSELFAVSLLEITICSTRTTSGATYVPLLFS